MAKVRYYEIDQAKRREIIGRMFEIFSGLKSKQEALDFFIGLLTPSEALMMARRIQIAEMLVQKMSYDEIRSALRISYNTIVKVDRWLNSGDEKYDQWIKKVVSKPVASSTNGKDGKKREKKSSLSYDYHSSLDKYAQHRLMKKLFG